MRLLRRELRAGRTGWVAIGRFEQHPGRRGARRCNRRRARDRCVRDRRIHALRLFTDPSQVDYLWGSYFTNVTGARPMPVTGSPDVGYLLGYALPVGTPFFGRL